MSAAREELHHLVDELDEDKVPGAVALLRELAARRDKPRTRPSWTGTLRAGPDSAERSEDILHAGSATRLNKSSNRRPGSAAAQLYSLT
jgi:hypothetical protein